MSTAEILSLVSLISYIAAGVCLFLALVFWFVFKIPVVIGDLSGRTARKSIEKMRQANIRSGSKSYRPSTENQARGKLTETMQHSAKLKKETASAKKAAAVDNGRPETGILAENKEEAYVAESTELLYDDNATAPLVEENATTLLEGVQAPVIRRTGGKKLTMINEVVLIHTDEVI